MNFEFFVANSGFLICAPQPKEKLYKEACQMNLLSIDSTTYANLNLSQKFKSLFYNLHSEIVRKLLAEFRPLSLEKPIEKDRILTTRRQTMRCTSFLANKSRDSFLRSLKDLKLLGVTYSVDAF